MLQTAITILLIATAAASLLSLADSAVRAWQFIKRN